MIDSEARTQLRTELDRLVSGETTNDEFDDLYFEHWYEADDIGVAEIARFGYGLYSSDLLWPYRLKGHHAVSPETNETANRCLLFLTTDLPYQWPKFRELSLSEGCLQGMSFTFGIPLGIALLIISLLMFVQRDVSLGFWLAIPAIVILGCVFAIAVSAQKRATVEFASFRSAGDFDAWPFITRQEFEAATRSLVALRVTSPPTSL